jgi:RNA polymerase sigma-70 factor (ECF subfamily)
VHSSADATFGVDALVREASEGDRQALEALLPRTLIDAAFAYVRHRVPTQEVAEDVLMDAVETALRGLPNFRGESSFATWLLAICRHKVADWHRGEARRRRLTSDDDCADVEALLDSRERGRAIVEACDRLRTPLREVFWLRKAQGLSAKEVASLTGLAESTVHAYVSQACTAIRRQLAQTYPELRKPGG